MNLVIKYLKVLIIPIGVLLLFPLILGLFNLLGLKTSKVLCLIIMIVTLLISGFMIGKKVVNKGYLNGIVLGISLSFIMFVFSLFFDNQYHINTIIYYVILIISSTIGSMFGIQKQKK